MPVAPVTPRCIIHGSTIARPFLSSEKFALDGEHLRQRISRSLSPKSEQSPISGWSIVTTGADGAVRIWDVGKGAVERQYQVRIEGPDLFRLFFTPDRKAVLAFGYHDPVILQDLESGKRLMRLGAVDRINLVALAPRRRVLAISELDYGRIRICYA
jgi:WD40 repeat protein